MKKSIAAFLSISILLAGISSCSKTNRSKLTNDWKVIASEEVLDIKFPNDDYSVESLTTYTESAFVSDAQVVNGEETIEHHSSGPVQVNEFIIKKDGTWSRNLEYTSVTGDSSTAISMISSGTWSFLGKNKAEDIGKNEKVLFNILAESTTDTRFSSAGVQIFYQQDIHSYLPGEKAETHLVKKSGKKELEFLYETKETAADASGELSTRLRKKTLTLAPQ